MTLELNPDLDILKVYRRRHQRVVGWDRSVALE